MSTPQRRAVIITALPVEREAILEHLEKFDEERPHRGSVYRKGIFTDRSEPWEIVVAEIGAGNEGAAAEAERVISHYDPQVAIFVGVAGAVKDFTHGDVIASTKVYNYGSGKERGARFETRPEMELPAYSLLARARHEAGEASWRERIRSIRPMPEGIAPPKAAVGPIAAGPKVLASKRGATLRFIREHYSDAVAVEMEGHGFLLGVRMNHPTQGIVIRGISDRIGDKRPAGDDLWQPVAARHAAAFAFQVLAKFTDPPSSRPDALAVDLGEEWQTKHLEDANRTAGPRYSCRLNVGTPIHDVFEALCGTEAWFASLQPRQRKLCKAIKHWSRCLNTTDAGSWGAPFPEHLREEGRAIEEGLDRVGNSFADLTERKEGASPNTITDAVGAMLPQLRELYQSLRHDLEAHHGEGTADSANFRQFSASYHCSFPTINVDAASDLVVLLEGLEAWGRSGPGRAAGAKGILLSGIAGAGKTHAICDIAHNRSERLLRTAILFGEHFGSVDDPWDRIRQMLGFGPMGRDDLLSALDAAGRKSGGPFLLCVDGLNESRPRCYWRDWLSVIVGQAARFPNIRVCVSIRSTYEKLIVPTGHGLERVEHVGFVGMENTACREFFEHHGLEPPVAPSFHPEFSNPLFLRLACETLKAADLRRMPTGWYGINTALGHSSERKARRSRNNTSGTSGNACLGERWTNSWERSSGPRRSISDGAWRMRPWNGPAPKGCRDLPSSIGLCAKGYSLQTPTPTRMGPIPKMWCGWPSSDLASISSPTVSLRRSSLMVLRLPWSPGR
jgi:nucleoside phosphorylase